MAKLNNKTGCMSPDGKVGQEDRFMYVSFGNIGRKGKESQ